MDYLHGDTKETELRVVVMWDYSRRDQGALSMVADFRQPRPIPIGNVTPANFVLAFRGALLYSLPVESDDGSGAFGFCRGARSYFRRARGQLPGFTAKDFLHRASNFRCN